MKVIIRPNSPKKKRRKSGSGVGAGTGNQSGPGTSPGSRSEDVRSEVTGTLSGPATALGLRRGVLGLDLGSSSLKWVLLRSGLRPRLLGSGAIPVKADLEEQLSEVRKLLGTEPSAVIATVPATRTYFQRLTLPFRDLRKLRSALPFELEAHLPRTVEGLNMDALAYEGGCIGVALDPAEFGPLRESLARAGLAARTLEPDILASVRSLLLSRDQWPESGGIALLDLGESKTGWALVERGQLTRVGSLHGGIAALVEALAERDGRSEEEVRAQLQRGELAAFSGVEDVLAARYQRVRLALRHAVREPAELILCGGGASIAGLDRLLGREMNARGVHILNPEGLGPAYAGAWGAAQRGVSREAPCSVRVLSAEPERLPFWTRSRARIAIGVAVTVAVLGAIDLQQQFSVRTERLRGLETRIERLLHSAAPEITRVVDGPEQLRVRVEEMERRLALFPNPGRDPTHPLAVLAAVSAAVPANVELDIFGYTQAADVLHIDGEIDSLGAVSALQSALEQLPMVQKVEVGPTRKAVSSDRVGFQMDLALAPQNRAAP